MSILFRRLWLLSFSLLVMSPFVSAMKRSADDERYAQKVEDLCAHAILEGNFNQLAELDPDKKAVNTPLMAVKLTSGKIVKMAPVLYAVYSNNKSLLENLLKFGAEYFGKCDQVVEYGTPLSESCKTGYTGLIDIIKNNWIMALRKAYTQTDSLVKQMIGKLQQQSEKAGFSNNQVLKIELDIYLNEQFVAAVKNSDTNKIKELTLDNALLANKAMIPTVVGEHGNEVALSPLAYAVHTANVPLILTLCECGAVPVGKLDTAAGIESPLLEAYKSGNHAVIAVMRQYALKYAKECIRYTASSLKIFLAPSTDMEREIAGICQDVWKFSNEQLDAAKQQMSRLQDLFLMLDQCSPEEVDLYLKVEDNMVSLSNIEKLGEVSAKAFTQAYNLLTQNSSTNT